MYAVKQFCSTSVVALPLFIVGIGCSTGDIAATGTVGVATGLDSTSKQTDVGGEEEDGETTNSITDQETVEVSDSSEAESEGESSSDSTSSTESTDSGESSGDGTQSSEEDTSSETEATGTDATTIGDSESVGTEDSGTNETEATGTDATTIGDSESAGTEDSGSEDSEVFCDLLEQDCADDQACYPSPNGLGGVCGTPQPGAGTEFCDRVDERCESGWYCSQDHFGSCQQLCDLSLEGDDCDRLENLPDFEMRCRDPEIHPMPKNVGYCSI